MSRDIEKYTVFQSAHRLVLAVYDVTRSFPSDERFGLISQMRRASASIPMNLAEGAARKGGGEFRYFVNIARGSLAEVNYQLRLSRDLKYISAEQYQELKDRCDEIGKMLTALFQKLNANKACCNQRL